MEIEDVDSEGDIRMSEDRRRYISLTNLELESIAERAAEIAIIKMQKQLYEEVGKTLIQKLMYVIGISAMVIFFYAVKNDVIKLP